MVRPGHGRAAPPEYLDFEIEIGGGRGRSYAVEVVRSPAGEARATLRFPFDRRTLENRLLAIDNALLRSGAKHRRILSPEEQAVQDFGRKLFEALFSGEIRARYDVSLREAALQRKGLRVKLRVEPPELAALPWEFLFDANQGDYVSLSRTTPVVRYLQLPLPAEPLPIARPLHILGVVVSPADQEPLDVAHEQQRIELALKPLQAAGMLELTWLEGKTWRDIQQAMRRGPWHIFHFIGHGGFDVQSDEGVIALADERGGSHMVGATMLGRLLADHDSLRLVILNACEGARGSRSDTFSSTAATLVRRGIPAVLAMQYVISDGAAIEFARTFYDALADGLPVDAAVTEARVGVSFAFAESFEWAVPVLFMRAPDGRLFDMAALPAAARETSITAPPPEPAHMPEKVTSPPDAVREPETPMPLAEAARAPEIAGPRPEAAREPVPAEWLPAPVDQPPEVPDNQPTGALLEQPSTAAQAGASPAAASLEQPIPEVRQPDVDVARPVTPSTGSEESLGRRAVPGVLVFPLFEIVMAVGWALSALVGFGLITAISVDWIRHYGLASLPGLSLGWGMGGLGLALGIRWAMRDRSSWLPVLISILGWCIGLYNAASLRFGASMESVRQYDGNGFLHLIIIGAGIAAGLASFLTGLALRHANPSINVDRVVRAASVLVVASTLAALFMSLSIDAAYALTDAGLIPDNIKNPLASLGWALAGAIVGGAGGLATLRLLTAREA